MTEVLMKEMHMKAKNEFTNETIDTIYLGGGTPSILSTEEIRKLISTIYQLWSIHANTEITLEANPEDIDTDNCRTWKSIGINRVSLGVQSIFDDELLWMNRAHNSASAKKAIDTLKKTGFEKFSVDLIYGGPYLSIERWKETLQWIHEQDLTHLSCYGLSVEPKTPLFNSIKAKRSPSPDPDKMAFQFEMLMEFADEHNWEHYEISNLAKNGHRSKHNSSYWKGTPYIGIGPSAHSFDEESRYWNIADNRQYAELIKKGILPLEKETLTVTQKLNEKIMTKLRCMEGCDLTDIEKFGIGKSEQLLKCAKKYIDNGQMVYENNSIILTKKGKLFADSITADLFFEEDSSS